MPTAAAWQQTIPGFGNPIAIACSPVDGTVLVADASTWQVKAFNSGGSLIWTHGQAGGFANGPRVTSDKFYWVFQDQGNMFTDHLPAISTRRHVVGRRHVPQPLAALQYVAPTPARDRLSAAHLSRLGRCEQRLARVQSLHGISRGLHQGRRSRRGRSRTSGVTGCNRIPSGWRMVFVRPSP